MKLTKNVACVQFDTRPITRCNQLFETYAEQEKYVSISILYPTINEY